MSFLPDKNTDYASMAYWNERYGTEESFEWCKSYAGFKDLIRKEVQSTDRILMLGNDLTSNTNNIIFIK